MEAYVLFAPAKEVIRFEEQEEDIGCPSESSAARSTSSSSSSSDGVDLADDASSSGSSCHFEMASLMTQLPIKYVRRTHVLADGAGIAAALLPDYRDLILAGVLWSDAALLLFGCAGGACPSSSTASRSRSRRWRRWAASRTCPSLRRSGSRRRGAAASASRTRTAVALPPRPAGSRRPGLG
jgi:hypothetical protein